jgi:hypothetical protein
MHKDAKEITLPDGSVTDTWSKEYMLYCEALSLSKKSLEYRRNWLNRLKDEDRVNKLKMWLKLLFSSKHLKKDLQNSSL